MLMLESPMMAIIIQEATAAAAAGAIFAAGSAPTIALWKRLGAVQDARDAELREIIIAMRDAAEAIRQMAADVKDIQRALAV